MKLKPIIAIMLVVVGVGVTWLCVRRAASPPSRTVVETNPVNSPEAQPEKKFPPPAPRNFPAATPGTAAAGLTPVQKIVSASADYQQRVEAIGMLSTNLPEEDSQALRNFLLRADPADVEQSGQVLKNQLLDTLCALNPPPSWLGETLIQMYNDRSQDGVIRDYAIQHLVAFYKQMDVSGIAAPEIRQAVRSTLWAALQETDSSIAGTALLALDRLSASDATAFDRKQIGGAALQLANDDGAGELSRITAFQVCAQMEMKDALPAVWRAAEQGRTGPVQISAIRALGILGGSAARPFLEKILSGTEERLKAAAQSALNEIKKHEQKI